jgi:tryptophan halogenase
MTAGWCWRIDHEERINRGYVYSTAFQSDDEAEKEFRSKNPKVTSTRRVNFITGRYERGWVKNVASIGNACGFVEPLEATSLGAICDESDSLAHSLSECDGQPTPSVMHHYNRRHASKWDNIRQFLGIHYKFNTYFDTPFWRECRAKADIGNAAAIVEYFQENGPGLFHKDTLLDPLNQFSLEGYWSLLIGQKVPCKRPYVPPPQERAEWRRIQQAFKAKALAACSTEEVLRIIRSPQFRWPPTFYSPQVAQVKF